MTHQPSQQFVSAINDGGTTHEAIICAGCGRHNPRPPDKDPARPRDRAAWAGFLGYKLGPHGWTCPLCSILTIRAPAAP